MVRESSQAVMKLKQVAIDKKQMNIRKRAEKKIIVLNQLAKDTRLNKVFKLILRLSKAILDIP